MSHASKIRMIREYYSRLCSITRPHSGGKTTMAAESPFTKYLDQIESEERQHRRMGTHFRHTYGRGLPVTRAVEYYAVRYLLSYRMGEIRKPAIELIGHLKLSLFFAWPIWAEWQREIRKAFSVRDATAFLDTLEYSSLVGGPKGDK